MKNTLVVITALATILSGNSQITSDKGTTAASQNLLAAGNNSRNSHGMTFFHVNPPRDIDGSVHLFDNWNNSAVIHTNDGQRFLVKNVNLNIERNTFESKVSEDSVFAFNFNNVKKTVVANKVYKNYYWDDDNRVYEVLYENQDYQLLKGFKVNFVEGSANPMLNRKLDRYVKKEYYFIRQDDKIDKFKLTKKRVLKLVDNDAEKAEMILDYAESNKLSFSKEADIKKILEYSAKN